MTPLFMLLAQGAPAGIGPATTPGTSSEALIIWAVILLGMALALFFVEVFVPAGGLIAMIGAGCLVAGVVALFRVDTLYGLIGAAASLAAIPFAVGFGMKIWPDLPLARWLILREAQTARDTRKNSVKNPGETSARGKLPGGGGNFRGLPGAAGGCRGEEVGEAVTDLHPVGICRIHGRRVECLAAEGLIETGAPVRVVSVDGLTIKVVEIKDSA